MTPEEAHLVNRLMDPPPKYDPLRRYIAVYRIKGELSLSAIAFTNQIAAWEKPVGPNVPRNIEIIDVILCDDDEKVQVRPGRYKVGTGPF